MAQFLALTRTILIGFYLLYGIDAFLFNGQCVASTPCSCHPTKIECDHRHLTDVPPFSSLRGFDAPYIDVNINGNHLTLIHQFAFRNLKSINATEIYVDLNDNQIYHIDVDAFDGIENIITKLNLKNNALKHLPAALQRLGGLKELDLVGNPLIHLDQSVMQTIGNHVRSFSVSLDFVNSVPTEFQYLNKLTRLTLDKFRFITLGTNIFHSFETSITQLVISSARLERLPNSLCLLSNLTIFEYVNSPNLMSYKNAGTALFDNWNSSCSNAHLTQLNLNGNDLSGFPAISHLFPKLQFMSVRHNRIQFIKDDALAYTPLLTNLDLSDNQFVRIPSPVNSMSNLTWLNMSGNGIVSIEDVDLDGLVKLTTLILDHNPIAHISRSAFRNNPLELIDLSQTNLLRIPTTLLKLTNLVTVSFGFKPIECSCSKMSTLKSWNMTFTIDGVCSTYFAYRPPNSMSIMEFLKTDLPKCP